MLRRSLLAFAVVAGTVVACSSLPDLTFGDGDAGGSEGGNPESSVAEGGGGDSGRDTAPPCIKSGAEICDDGLDNDCNGLKDCEDPACGGFTCVSPAPDGWTLAALAESAPPACPTGYTSTNVRVLSGAAQHACPCTCVGSGGSGATCAGATTAVTTGDDSTCTTAQTAQPTLNSNVGVVCTPLPALPDLVVGSSVSTGFGKITTPAGPLACTPNATITKTDPTDGRICAPIKVGGGCMGTNQCVPKADGFTMCISKAGDQVCPTGFSKRRPAGATSDDTRTCTACSCNNSPCAGTVTVWANSMCNAKKSILTTAANTACAAPQAGSDTNVTAKFYTSTIAGGCSVGTAPTATGTLAFTDPRTVCCK